MSGSTPGGVVPVVGGQSGTSCCLAPAERSVAYGKTPLPLVVKMRRFSRPPSGCSWGRRRSCPIMSAKVNDPLPMAVGVVRPVTLHFAGTVVVAAKPVI